MSSLQISLAVAGGVVLAALVAHGAWVARRNAPKQAQPDTQPQPGADSPAADDQRREPGFDGPLEAMPLPHLEKRPGLDALIDVIAPIALDGLVSGDAALAAMPATRRAGSKPFAIEGQNDATGVWEMPQAGQRYRAFQAGVQLANRTGHLNEIEFSEFVMKAQGFADAVNGSPEFPDMIEEVGRARELDQFASDHDAHLAFTLRARAAAWSPGFVHQAAGRLGFVPGAIPGRMVLAASETGLPPILGLAFDSQAAFSDDPDQSAIREIRLSLDVPLVQRAERPFVRLREAAMALAATMDGVITDDNAQIIRPESLDAIGADLEQLYDTLDAHDLAAGSPQARRLFS
ncbi:MAG: cell division protein FtsZ [Burkholderiaceae bacterium]